LPFIMADDSPIGARGRVTSTGAIRPGRTGEVMVAIGGGVQAYLARDVDGGEIAAYEVFVVDHIAPRGNGSGAEPPASGS
jgi:hypothetical protein